MSLEKARRDRATCPSALMVDVDHLKLTNDEYGHAAGDKLLIAAADVLRMSVRGGDIVARLGGDEFAVLMLEQTSSQRSVWQRVPTRPPRDGVIPTVVSDCCSRPVAQRPRPMSASMKRSLGRCATWRGQTDSLNREPLR